MLVGRLRAVVAGGRKTLALDWGCGGIPTWVIGFWLAVAAALLGMFSVRPFTEAVGP